MIDRTLNYGRHNIRRFLLKAAPFRNVLDVGAGSGLDLEIAGIVSPSARLSAVELSEPNIMNLKKRTIEIYKIDIEKESLPFDNDFMDIIIANQILEHTKEIFWVMHEITRVLKVGGTFIVGVPNLASFHNRLLLFMGSQPTSIQLHSAHVRGFTKSGLINFMHIYPGFRLLDFKGSNFYPFPPVLAKPLARLFPALAWGIFFHFNKTMEYANEFLDYLNNEHLETFYYRGRQE